MWNSSIPTKGDEFTLQGCVFGCIVGNDSFTQTQAEFSEGFGWSGCGAAWGRPSVSRVFRVWGLHFAARRRAFAPRGFKCKRCAARTHPPPHPSPRPLPPPPRSKCFSEERVDGTPKRFASVLNRNYQARGASAHRRSAAARRSPPRPAPHSAAPPRPTLRRPAPPHAPHTPPKLN